MNLATKTLASAAASIALANSGTSASAQSCSSYFADLGHLPLQWYAMNWTVFNNGDGKDVYKASAYGDFIERRHNDVWSPVSRTGLPAGYTAVGIHSTRVDGVMRLYALMRRQSPESYLWYPWGGFSWLNEPIPNGILDGYDTVGGYPVFVNLSTGVSLFGRAYPHDPPYPIDSAVAKFENGHWSTIGSCERYVRTLLVLPDGEHEALWAVGSFPSMNGVPAPGIAKWNGQTWTGFPGPQFLAGYAGALTADLGTGMKIYAHGSLDGQPTTSVCCFDGSQWVFIGSPDPLPPPSTPSYITTMGVFDDGRGPALYIGGIFSGFAGVSARNIVRWDGAHFEAVGAGIVGEPSWFGAYQDVRGSAMFIGGDVLTGAGGGTLQQSAVALVGCQGGQCYVNCDLSTAAPRLNANDFQCFLNAFARRDPYANCTVDAAINIADFMCFMNKFAAGCP